MVPTGEQAAFEMIESEFALEVFVHALGAPALLQNSTRIASGTALSYEKCLMKRSDPTDPRRSWPPNTRTRLSALLAYEIGRQF